MKPGKKHIVIIGGGFAGLSTAKKLRKSQVDVTIIDKSNHHLFQPLLYQVATAALSPGDIAAPIRAILGRRSTARVLLGTVDKINPLENSLTLADGRNIFYDTLVLAPGAKYNYFGNDTWEKYAPGLKTLGDALTIRERILLSLEQAEQLEGEASRKPFLTYVIIGGGPTGVEMAGAIAEIAKRSMRYNFQNLREEEIRIFLIEATPTILNGFPDPLGEKGLKMLENLGVIVRLNSPVTKIEQNKVHLNNEVIETTNIIWAAGIKASPLLEFIDTEKDRSGRIIVNNNLSVPGHPNIFILGDSAHFKDEKGEPLPALASVASQQGEFLGNILATPGLKQEEQTFKYVDKGQMATIGRAKAVADIKGLKFSGFFAWFLWSAVHILLLIGFRNRLRVFIEWMWNYFTFKRGVQLITDRPHPNSF